MSQSWDNVASIHDHLLTVHAHKTDTYFMHKQYPAWASSSTVRMRK